MWPTPGAGRTRRTHHGRCDPFVMRTMPSKTGVSTRGAPSSSFFTLFRWRSLRVAGGTPSCRPVKTIEQKRSSGMGPCTAACAWRRSRRESARAEPALYPKPENPRALEALEWSTGLVSAARGRPRLRTNQTTQGWASGASAGGASFFSPPGGHPEHAERFCPRSSPVADSDGRGLPLAEMP